jgi:hypothetical protein
MSREAEAMRKWINVSKRKWKVFKLAFHAIKIFRLPRTQHMIFKKLKFP